VIAGILIGIFARPELRALLRWSFFYLLLFAIGYSVGPQFGSLKSEAVNRPGARRRPERPGGLPESSGRSHKPVELAKPFVDLVPTDAVLVHHPSLTRANAEA
jgi:hypothetical protein